MNLIAAFDGAVRNTFRQDVPSLGRCLHFLTEKAPGADSDAKGRASNATVRLGTGEGACSAHDVKPAAM